MAPSLDNLGWFYRGKAEQAVGVPETLDHKIIYSLLATCTVVGFFAIFVQLFNFIRLLFSLFVLPGKALKTFGQPSKTWALITGASDGIGKEYALQLARAGYSTLLVSRTQSKLDDLAADIKSKYNTPTKTLAMDFGANNDSDYAKLKALVDGLDVAILINNVGVSHSIPVPFVETPKEEIDSIITVNCIATLRVTQTIVPGMIQRKRGLIVTMGSFGGLIPTPLLATYSGSKAFLQQWSTALGSELAPKGVTVELVQSHLVTSAMSKIRKSSATVPSPKMFVKSVLGSIGRTGGAQGWTYTSTPYWSHAVLQWTVSTFVGSGNKLLLLYNRRFHVDIRRRALAKKARLEGEKGK